MDGDELPGEISEEAQRAALEEMSLRLISEGIQAMSDVYLDRLTMILHEEDDRRRPELGCWARLD